MGASVHYGTGSQVMRWRNTIASAAREEWGEGVTAIGPVALVLTFVMERPRSHYADLQGTVKARYIDAEPTARPDLDKLVRAILDALTGIVYDDDSQVIHVAATKEFGRHPSVRVEIVDHE